MPALRVFVSSPSDVAPERARVDAVADRLNGEFEGLAHLEVVRWETGFYTADRSFQEAISAALDRMRATDIVVCILWKRVGSELNPLIWLRPNGTVYESGTVLEVETAVEVSLKENGSPDVYLFRKAAPITYASESFEADRLQHQLLETVWHRWTETEQGHNSAGYQRFDGPDDFEQQLELCLRQWLERKGIILKAVWDRRIKGSPFRGLAAFDAGHAPVFFGRDGHCERAIAKLRQAENVGAPFLLLIGASGAGKSSLLRAGLVPRITRPGIIPGIDQWRPVLVVPSADPLLAFARALFADGELGEQLRAGDFNSEEALARCFAAGAEMALLPILGALDREARYRAQLLYQSAPRPARLLIAVDQVEWLFTEADPDLAGKFAALLRVLAERKLATVIVALRSDSYARFQQLPDFVALLEAGGVIYNLVAPANYELEEIVTKPVTACQPPLAFEINDRGLSLADQLVADAKGGDALPLLQMTLQRLFEAETQRGDGVLRFADYPGIDAAVTLTADHTIADLGPIGPTAADALVTALVSNITQDANGALVPVVVSVDRAEFERGMESRTRLVEAFIQNRLLTTELSQSGSERIRPIHDALLRAWPAASRVITENAALIRVRHTLEPMVGEWLAAAESAKPGYLLTSAALLAGAETLLTRFGDDLSPEMQEFISASLAAAARQRNAERRRHRRILAATAAGLVIAVSLAGIAGWQWRVASSQRAEARAQRDRAEQSLALATSTANSLIFNLAHDFRHLGIPAGTIGDILDRAQELQKRLAAGGAASPELRQSHAAALREASITRLALGDTNGALSAATQARDILQTLVDEDAGRDECQHDLALSYTRIADVLVARGDLKGAVDAYRESTGRLKWLAAEHPDKTQWQGDLATSTHRVGDNLVMQGDLPGALAAYRESLALRQSLAAKEPDNTAWQRELSGSYDAIGDALNSQGDASGALEAYRKSLVLLQALVQKDPMNTQWQRDLAWSYDRFGEKLVVQGDIPGALEAYRNSLSIRRTLAMRDPKNADWQSDLTHSDNQIGDAFAAQGDLARALMFYRDGLGILKELVSRDPGSSHLQREVSVADNRIGDVLAAQADLAGALAIYREGLAVIKVLAAKDPDNTIWQSDVASSNSRIGNVLAALGQRDEALAAYSEALVIRKAQAERDSENVIWQRDLAIVETSIGDVQTSNGDLAAALIAHRNALAIRQKLASKQPEYIVWQRDLAITFTAVGDVLAAQANASEAESAYRAAVAIRRDLALKTSANAAMQRELLSTYMRIGVVSGKHDELDVALAAFEQAETLALELRQANPAAPASEGDLAAVETQLNNIRSRISDKRRPASK